MSGARAVASLALAALSMVFVGHWIGWWSWLVILGFAICYCDPWDARGRRK